MAEKKVYLDLSRLDAEQKAQYDALVAKASVDPAAAQQEMEGEEPPAAPETPQKTEKAEVEDMDDAKKSAAPAPELQTALDELATLKKSFAMKEMTEIAKKYAPLGKDEAELAKTLYDMKEASPANYDAYIKILDESLDIVNKSGLFAEIGKSAGGQSTANSAEEKAAAKAREIMKADPSINYTTAIAKAWDENPELMDEYDAERNGNK